MLTTINKKAQNNPSTIKKFLVLKEKMFEEALTPTLKIRRKIINDKYKDQIDKLYVDDVTAEK